MAWASKIFYFYNGNQTIGQLEAIANELHAHIKGAFPLQEIQAWVNARFSFNKHNAPYTNAWYEKSGEWLNYGAANCSGGCKLAETILVAA